MNMANRKQEKGPLPFGNVSIFNYFRVSPARPVPKLHVPGASGGASDDEADDNDLDADADQPLTVDAAVVAARVPHAPKARKGKKYAARTSAADKVAAVELAKEVGPAEAARRLGIAQTTVITWGKTLKKAGRAQIAATPPGAAPFVLSAEEVAGLLVDKRAKNNGRRVSSEVHRLLHDFFLAARKVFYGFCLTCTQLTYVGMHVTKFFFFIFYLQKNVAIDRTLLRAKALALVKKLDSEAAKWFKGSHNFFCAFENTHKISKRRTTSSVPTLPEGQTKESMRHIFLAHVADVVQTHGIPPNLVFQADETAQYLMPASKTTLEPVSAANVVVVGQGKNSLLFLLIIF